MPFHKAGSTTSELDQTVTAQKPDGGALADRSNAAHECWPYALNGASQSEQTWPPTSAGTPKSKTGTDCLPSALPPPAQSGKQVWQVSGNHVPAAPKTCAPRRRIAPGERLR